MALKLIRRGARLHPVEVKPGTGWVNVTKAGDTNPYFGPGVFTAQASNCDGVRLFDFAAKGTPHVESQAGNWKQVSAIVTGMAVVRVLNPTENTEVTIMSEPLPPPLRNCVLARLGVAPWR